ncbi:MAG TPA: Dyp-type peroxidase [Polyangia bacterium]|nr:Dyp-type peroxidase [Polyangia bacterium]
MHSGQPAILNPPPRAGRFLTFGLARDAAARDVVTRLAGLTLDDRTIIGVGEPLVRALGREIPGLRSFPEVTGPGGRFPSTQGAVWAFFGGDDAGEVLHRARRLVATLGDAVELNEDVASFMYGGGRDLSGYVDGTENPKDDRAVEVAFATGGGTTFVATQKWVHDLGGFEKLSVAARNDVIGRDLDTDEELPDAPETAHVKRAAQESYDPPAFILRRSMPWGDVRQHGLYFVAYGASLDPFEHILHRMVGLEDGKPDALLTMSRAVTGGYFWCAPVTRDKRLDLSAIGV